MHLFCDNYSIIFYLWMSFQMNGDVIQTMVQHNYSICLSLIASISKIFHLIENSFTQFENWTVVCLFEYVLVKKLGDGTWHEVFRTFSRCQVGNKQLTFVEGVSTLGSLFGSKTDATQSVELEPVSHFGRNCIEVRTRMKFVTHRFLRKLSNKN